MSLFFFFFLTRVPCPPYYSSINYILLGLIAQHLARRSAWEDFDQLGVIPRARQHLYDQTSFPKLGPCAQYPVSHQYATADTPASSGSGPAPSSLFWDMIQSSCLNG